MFNLDGKVIVILSRILPYPGGSEGLGFAVSIDTASELLFKQGSPWTGLKVVKMPIFEQRETLESD